MIKRESILSKVSVISSEKFANIQISPFAYFGSRHAETIRWKLYVCFSEKRHCVSNNKFECFRRTVVDVSYDLRFNSTPSERRPRRLSIIEFTHRGHVIAREMQRWSLIVVVVPPCVRDHIKVDMSTMRNYALRNKKRDECRTRTGVMIFIISERSARIVTPPTGESIPNTVVYFRAYTHVSMNY